MQPLLDKMGSMVELVEALSPNSHDQGLTLAGHTTPFFFFLVLLFMLFFMTSYFDQIVCIFFGLGAFNLKSI